MGCGLTKHRYVCNHPDGGISGQRIESRREVVTKYTCFGLVPWSVQATSSVLVDNSYSKEDLAASTGAKDSLRTIVKTI